MAAVRESEQYSPAFHNIIGIRVYDANESSRERQKFTAFADAFCTQIEEIIFEMFRIQAKKIYNRVNKPTILLLTVVKRGERRDVSPSISRVHGFFRSLFIVFRIITAAIICLDIVPGGAGNGYDLSVNNLNITVKRCLHSARSHAYY
jgi:hypothetical protein